MQCFSIDIYRVRVRVRVIVIVRVIVSISVRKYGKIHIQRQTERERERVYTNFFSIMALELLQVYLYGNLRRRINGNNKSTNVKKSPISYGNITIFLKAPSKFD